MWRAYPTVLLPREEVGRDTEYGQVVQQPEGYRISHDIADVLWRGAPVDVDHLRYAGVQRFRGSCWEQVLQPVTLLRFILYKMQK